MTVLEAFGGAFLGTLCAAGTLLAAAAWTKRRLLQKVKRSRG